jgi:hypothetical protein
MKTQGRVDVQTHILLTSVLVRGERSASRPGRIAPGKTTPGTHLIGDWVGPRTGLDDGKRENSRPYRDWNSDLLGR